RLLPAAFAPCTSPVQLDNLPDGAQVFEARAIDAAANVDPSPARHSWTIDTTAPAAPSISLPAAAAILATGRPAIEGSAEAGSTVTVAIDGTVIGSAAAAADGHWIVPVDAAHALLDGPHSAVASARDAANNVSADSLPRAF